VVKSPDGPTQGGEMVKIEEVRKLALLAMVLAVLPCLAAACTGRGGQVTTIGAMLRYESSPYFRDIETGLTETAYKKGARVIVFDPGRKDAGEQGELLHRLMRLNAQVLVFSPDDEVSCISAILEARRKGIPVIFLSPAIEQKKLDDARVRVDCQILCDQEKGGAKAARFMAEKLRGRGLVVILEGTPTNSNIRRRIGGFRKTLEGYPAIRTAVIPVAGFNERTAYDACRIMIKKYPAVKGIFAVNDVMAIGAAKALEGADNKGIMVTGFDGTIEGLTAVREKRIDATVNQFPGEMGRLVVENALKLRRGDTEQPLILMEPEIITIETVQLPFH